MIVQIYAATSVDEALAMARLGVDHIGFVAGDYGQVHAELTFTQAREIAETLQGKAKSSALTMSTAVAEILRMVETVRPDIVHISSEMEAVGVEAMAQLRRALPARVALMKAIAVGGPESIAAALRFARVADILLLDTKVSGLPGVGATGVKHDWNISRQIIEQVNAGAAEFHCKVILAGGLTTENVKTAIAATRPWGVDSNTGTNIPGDPVVKEMKRVKAFVEQAKNMNQDDAPEVLC